MSTLKSQRIPVMPTRVIDELSRGYGLTVEQLQKLAILDGVLIEDIDLTTTATLVPHKLGRVYRGFFVVKGHTGGSSTSSVSSSTSTTTYGTLWRWNETDVTEFTSVVGSGASLSTGTQTGDGKDACITIATGTTAGTALWLWTITDLEVSPHHWIRCAVDTASNANVRAGIAFYYVDASNWCAYTKGGNTANGVFLRYNNATLQTRAATPTLGTEGASNDLAYLHLTLEGKLPTSSTDPGLRGHIGGPGYVPGATSSIINATDYGATWNAAWQQNITGFKVGIFAQALGALGASVNLKISQLAVMAHPGATDTSSTASTAVFTSQASGITEDTTSTDFDRSKFIRITAATDQTVSLWVF